MLVLLTVLMAGKVWRAWCVVELLQLKRHLLHAQHGAITWIAVRQPRSRLLLVAMR
jgi:hypothetical protein